MKGADFCVYSGFKSNQAFQGFVLLTYKTTADLQDNKQHCWEMKF